MLLLSSGFLVNFTSSDDTFHCWLKSDVSNAFLLNKNKTKQNNYFSKREISFGNFELNVLQYLPEA